MSDAAGPRPGTRRHLRRLQAALGIALLAGLTRLHDLEGARFRGDEAIHLHRAAAIARGELAPLLGVPSTDGLETPAALHWLLAVPVGLFGPRPLPAMATVGLANAVALGAWLLLARRAGLGRLAALGSAGLLAASPGLAANGSGLWHPDLAFPAAVLALGLSLRAARPGGEAACGPALLAAGGAAAVHYSGAAALAGALLAWLAPAPRRRLRLPGPWLALGLTALALGPALLAPRRQVEPPGGAEQAPGLLAAAAGTLGAGEALAIAGPDASAAALVGAAAMVPAADALLLLLAAGGLLWGLRPGGALTRRGQRAAILAWLAVGAAPLLLGVVPVRTHYTMVLAPCLGLGAGLALEALAGARRSGWRRPAAVALLALGLAWACLATLRLHAALRERGGAPGAPHDVALRHKLAAVRRVVDGGLALCDYPALEYLILAELEGRLRGVSATRRVEVPYWGLSLALPLPPRLGPGRWGRIRTSPPAAGEAIEAWREGPLWVLRTEAPPGP